MRRRASGDFARILHPPPFILRPPPHLLVSRSTVMLGVGHMVCAEDARTGIALERQKICRKWVRLQVQWDLDVPAHSAFHSGAGKHCRTRNQLDPGPTPLSPTPRPKLEPRPPRALPAQEPASPPGPASRVLRPSPLHPLTQALTARLRTVSPKVRKLHRRAGRGPAGRGRDAELPEGSSSGSKSRPRTLGGTPCPAPSSPRPSPLYRSVRASRTAVLTPPLARAGA